MSLPRKFPKRSVLMRLYKKPTSMVYNFPTTTDVRVVQRLVCPKVRSLRRTLEQNLLHMSEGVCPDMLYPCSCD